MWKAILLYIIVPACLLMGLAFIMPRTNHPVSGVTDVVKVSATLIPCRIPGKFRLEIVAIIKDGYHIYSITQQSGGPNATVIGFEETNEPVKILRVIVDPLPVVTWNKEVWPGLPIEIHFNSVKWTFYIKFNGQKKSILRGFIQVAPCSETGCLIPIKIPFFVEIKNEDFI